MATAEGYKLGNRPESAVSPVRAGHAHLWESGVQENHRCEECQRLWGEYVSAVLEYVRLDRQVYFATLRQESSQIPGLHHSLGSAVIAKDAVRDLIREHAATHLNASAASA